MVTENVQNGLTISNFSTVHTCIPLLFYVFSVTEHKMSDSVFNLMCVCAVIFNTGKAGYYKMA